MLVAAVGSSTSEQTSNPFVRSDNKRNVVAMLQAAYTRENLKACAPHKAGLVKVYRAGYSPAERRQLEADLHSGALVRCCPLSRALVNCGCKEG